MYRSIKLPSASASASGLIDRLIKN